MVEQRSLIPDRPHINLWREQVRGASPKLLREWREQWEETKRRAPQDVDDPTDTIIICNAALIAISEELKVQRYG